MPPPGHVFARYAYPPNVLGYCGPPDPRALVEASSGSGDSGNLGSLARSFTGAWPYLELIAATNGIADPLAPEVVEAYWIGNALLDGVPSSALLEVVEQHPDARLLSRSQLREAVTAGGVAHHCFHVFAVYPWLGVLRSGRGEPALTVLDRCRIRWGRVARVDGDEVTVQSRPLGYDGRALVLLEERVERARRGPLDGLGPVGDLVPGDVVSLHWDWLCDRLDPGALTSLEHFTARSMAAVNATGGQS